MSNKDPRIPREVLDDMFAALEASRKATPPDEQPPTESAATLGVRGYRNGYRVGWNDALDALSRSACAGCSDEHWLKRELLRLAASMKRR